MSGEVRHSAESDRGRIEDLIERSSLGTPEAKALRATVSDEHAARIVARAKELESAESAALREAVAEMVRDHTMPPNKDQRGYDYRMGWWDAVTYLDSLVKRRVREARPTPPGGQS